MSQGGRDDVPPRVSRWILQRVLPPRHRGDQLAELDEEFSLRARTDPNARRWYRSQVVRSLLPALACRFREYGLGAGGAGPLVTIRDDLTHAFRSLRRSPGFTALVTLLLAVGIGVNGAAFAVVHAVLLRPLPYPNADRIVYVQGSSLDAELLPTYRDALTSFAEVAVHGVVEVTIEGPGALAKTTAMPVTEGFFDVFGMSPSVGRPLTAQDHDAASAPAAVVSGRLAERRFGTVDSALGASLVVDGRTFTIVGVMPGDWRFHRFPYTELWVPTWTRSEVGRRVVGLLRETASFERAEAEVVGLARRIEAAEGKERGVTHVVPLHDAVVGRYRAGLNVLGGVVLLVLLVAVANVSALILVRNERRARDVSVRVALGASRGRLARQVFAEAGVLALGSSALGVVLARWVTQALIAAQPAALPRSHEIGLDASVIAYTFLVALGCSVLAGLPPAFTLPTASRARSGSAEAAPASVRARSALVVAEVAVATSLLVGTALLLRTYVALYPSDPGFESRDRLAFRVDLPATGFADGRARAALVEDLLAELGRLPAVRRVSATSDLPMTRTNLAFRIPLPGWEVGGESVLRAVHYRVVTPNYLESLGMPILRGRGLESTDRDGSEPVAVVNETMAAEFWPGEDPLGRRIRMPGVERGETDLLVVGVVGDAWISPGRAESRPEVFVPFDQERVGSLAFVVGADAPGDLAGSATEVVHRLAPGALVVGPNRRVDRPRPMADILSDALAPWRYQTTLVGFFAALALLLTGVGLFGVLGSAVNRQQHGIGVRIALGGTPWSVATGVLREGAMLVGWGIGAGVMVAFAGSRVLESFVYGVSLTDPASYVASALVICVVGGIACALPVRRATGTDPLGVLRSD